METMSYTMQHNQPNIVRLDSVTSTNDHVKENSNNYYDNTIVVANKQTAGRGRNTNSWFSNAGSLALSALYFPEIHEMHLPMMNLFPAVAVCHAIQDMEIDAKIKWPNDIYLDGYKISGVLCESRVQHHFIKRLIIGIGINVQQVLNEFPEDIKRAGSLFSQTGKQLSKEVVLHKVITELTNFYNQYVRTGNFAAIRQMWMECCFHIDTDVSLLQNNYIFSGTFKGIAENGAALIGTESGVKQIHNYNSISLRGLYASGR